MYLFRCLIIDQYLHACNEKAVTKYSGSGVVTVGTWPTNTLMEKNLLVDHLIISSRLIHVHRSVNQDLCFAKLVDKRLPWKSRTWVHWCKYNDLHTLYNKGEVVPGHTYSTCQNHIQLFFTNSLPNVIDCPSLLSAILFYITIQSI